MKKLLISLAVVGVLVGIMAAPVMAASSEEGSVPASVSVSTFVNITISGDISLSGDPDTVLGPATITVTVQDDTNVDIDVGIKGETTDTEILIGAWMWSVDLGTTKNPLIGSYAEVAGDVTDSVAIEHYVDTTDASPGAHTATIWYKAVAAGAGFGS